MEMDISQYASKYDLWKDEFNWESCKVGHKKFGEFLASHLTFKSRVINLNGVYGAGKTQFVKRLYTHLAEQRHSVVYINVWESDFSDNPLAVICSELIEQIETVFKSKIINPKEKDTNVKFNKLKGAIGSFLKWGSVASLLNGNVELSKMMIGSATAMDSTPNLNSEDKYKKLLENVKDRHFETINALETIRETITFLSDLMETIYELKTPIVIIVDELDRCRPSYSIEVLEVIKHFFETKGCSFLLATNTPVLEQSIKAIYGDNFAADVYLRRFFERKITLPEASISDYVNLKKEQLISNDSRLTIYPFKEDAELQSQCFGTMLTGLGLSLRDVDQVLSKYSAAIEYIQSDLEDGRKDVINSVVLMYGLILQHIDVPIDGSNFWKFKYGLKNKLKKVFSISIDSYVSLNFSFSLMTLSDEEYRPEGAGIRYATDKEVLLAFSSHRKYSELLTGGVKSRKLEQEIARDFDSASANYWLWEDYQKAIGLTASIE